MIKPPGKSPHFAAPFDSLVVICRRQVIADRQLPPMQSDARFL
jgi:hypothetical protein